MLGKEDTESFELDRNLIMDNEYFIYKYDQYNKQQPNILTSNFKYLLV